MNLPSSRTLSAEYEQLLAVARGEWLRQEGAAAPSALKRVRDLILFELLGGLYLVIACDSNASIGEKPNDALSKSYAEVGISALKVPMMEVLAAGAMPFLVVNALCMEMEPSGQRMIEAMQGALQRAGFDPDMMLTGSTEDNARTTQSGIGVTVLGVAHEDRLRIGRTQPGDVVFCVGNPKGGVTIPYTEFDPDIASIETVLALLYLEGVHEILPVGSKGVMREAQELGGVAGTTFHPADPLPEINLCGSAGASTAVLVSAPPDSLVLIMDSVDVPVYSLGSMK